MKDKLNQEQFLRWFGYAAHRSRNKIIRPQVKYHK